jgi:hypothetical protein
VVEVAEVTPHLVLEPLLAGVVQAELQTTTHQVDHLTLVEAVVVLVT